MRTRRVAHDVPDVTVVGFGDVSPAVAASRGIDHRDLERSVNDAIELGITLVDIDDDEGAEKMAGDAIKAHRARDRVVATTQVAVGVRPTPGAITNATSRSTHAAMLDARAVQERVERALRALRLDVLPLVQLPLSLAWTTSRGWLEFIGALVRMQREGKVIAWAARPDASYIDAAAASTDDDDVTEDPGSTDSDGSSSSSSSSAGSSGAGSPFTTTAGGLFMPVGGMDLLATLPADPAAAAAMLAMPPSTRPAAASRPGRVSIPEPFAAIVVPYSLCDRAAAKLVARAAAQKLGVFIREPLAGGALGGHVGPGMKLAIHDDRREVDLHAIAEHVAKLARLVEITPPSLKEVHDRIPAPLAKTIAELALRFTIDLPGVTATLPRLHRREHLTEAITCAAASALSPSTTEQIISMLGA